MGQRHEREAEHRVHRRAEEPAQLRPEPHQGLGVLSGRDAERASIAGSVDEAWAGRGGALVLVGPPGVGKSALLADAVARAEGMTVLHTQGVESESPLAFAALQRLLRPVMADRVQHLPQPQARALRAAFGEIDDGPGDRFLVFLATSSVLADTGQHRPVLPVAPDVRSALLESTEGNPLALRPTGR